MHRLIFGICVHYPNKGFPLASTHFHVEISGSFIYFLAFYPDYRGTGPLKTTMDVIDAAKVGTSFGLILHACRVSSCTVIQFRAWPHARKLDKI